MSYDFIEKLILLPPSNIISDLEIRLSNRWTKKTFCYTPAKFDLSVPAQCKIPSFGGNLAFDFAIWKVTQSVFFGKLIFLYSYRSF